MGNAGDRLFFSCRKSMPTVGIIRTGLKLKGPMAVVYDSSPECTFSGFPVLCKGNEMLIWFIDLLHNLNFLWFSRCFTNLLNY